MKHLHRDYHTAHCGLDASHIPMTFDPKEATCKNCMKGLESHIEAEEIAQQERDRNAKMQREAARARAQASAEATKALEERIRRLEQRLKS